MIYNYNDIDLGNLDKLAKNEGLIYNNLYGIFLNKSLEKIREYFSGHDILPIREDVKRLLENIVMENSENSNMGYPTLSEYIYASGDDFLITEAVLWAESENSLLDYLTNNLTVDDVINPFEDKISQLY